MNLPVTAAPDNAKDCDLTPHREELLGICYDRIALAQVMASIQRSCEERLPLQIVTVNTNFVTLVQREPWFSKVITSAQISVVDGRPLLWLTRLLDRPAPEQITGHDLFSECLDLANRQGYGIFLLGGEPGVAQRLAQQLQAERPGLRITGTHHGRFTRQGNAEDQAALDRQIRAFKPDIIFVALGAPKQDAWIGMHLQRLNIPVGIGVGCVFDVFAGDLPRAPRWMQRAGLESLFQLAVAPRRYARRYLLDDLPTLARLTGHVLARRWRRLGETVDAGGQKGQG